jgi:hypothetical protein
MHCSCRHPIRFNLSYISSYSFLLILFIAHVLSSLTSHLFHPPIQRHSSLPIPFITTCIVLVPLSSYLLSPSLSSHPIHRPMHVLEDIPPLFILPSIVLVVFPSHSSPHTLSLLTSHPFHPSVHRPSSLPIPFIAPCIILVDIPTLSFFHPPS